MSPASSSTGLTGFRLLVRQVYYHKERDGFGCDREDCGCRKHLRFPDLDAMATETGLFPRFRHILRLEGMINVGCKFSPNDLEWDQWRDLQVVSIERQWIQEQVRELRDTLREDTKQAHEGMAAARQAAGVPGPGQSLFGGKAASAKRSR